jgi:LysM repeat protein
MVAVGFGPVSRPGRNIDARGPWLLCVALLALSSCATPTTAHRVRPNETLAGIATAYGVDPVQLARTNELLDANRIEVGQELALPRGAQIVHVVRAGETLGEIADRYRVRVKAICRLNRIRDPDWIEVGQRLWLPQEAVLVSQPPHPPHTSNPAHDTPPAPTQAKARSIEAEEHYKAEARLIEAEEHYMAARFERALEDLQEVDALLERDPEQSTLRARAAFVAGSALVGLGEERRAREQFARVRVLDPGFEPPAGWLSPRLEALYGGTSAR